MKLSVGLAIISAIIATVGQTLLKQVMSTLGPIEKLSFSLVLGLIKQPLFYVAGAVYVLGFALWLIVLSRLELSVAYPILALTYVLVPISSIVFFDETIPPLRWAGVLVIIIGVVLVGFSEVAQ